MRAAHEFDFVLGKYKGPVDEKMSTQTFSEIIKEGENNHEILLHTKIDEEEQNGKSQNEKTNEKTKGTCNTPAKTSDEIIFCESNGNESNKKMINKKKQMMKIAKTH